MKKKKTITGATALVVLASATIPVYTAPVEANGSEKKLSNPVSTAESAVDPMNVYTSFTESVNSNSGNGSAENPYNRFEDAIAHVNDGGTIYIDANNGAFLNDVGSNLPFLIDKNVTIKPVDGTTNAKLSVRSAGIILGADVKFENITLEFANKYHDSIFANGYTLDLINVTRANGSREVDLFAGGLYELNGSQIHHSGNNGVINIEVNDNYGGGNLMSSFGNIYAGSMNGSFNGSAEINVSNASSNGSLKKLDIGAIKASGALEADAGSMLDIEEPLPPSENPSLYPMKGNVTVNLHNYQIDVDGATGSDAKTSVATSTIYPNELPLKNVNHLTVESGHIKVVCDDATTIPNVTLKDGTTLDLTKAGQETTINSYNGNGFVVLRKDGKLNITNPMNGSIELQTDGAFNGYSGLVEENHVYVTTSNEDANITFTPHYTQEYLELVANKIDTVVEWTIQEIDESTDELPPEEEIQPEEPPVEEDRDEINPTDIVDLIVDSESYEFHADKWLVFNPKLKLKDGSIVTIPRDSAIFKDMTLDYSSNISAWFANDSKGDVVASVDSNGAKNGEIILSYKGLTKKVKVSSYYYALANDDEIINLDLNGNESIEVKVNKVYEDKTIDVKDFIKLHVADNKIIKSDGNVLTALREGMASVGIEVEGWILDSLVVNVIDTSTKEESTPQPPVVTPPTNNSGGGSVIIPPVEEEVAPPTDDEVQPEVSNGIEDLESLDKELQEKVDSIVAETVVQEQGLLLTVTGDKEDVRHVKEIEVTSEGIFANVDGKKLKFRNSLEELELDLMDARAVRVVDESQRAVVYKAIPHQTVEKGLKVTSSNLEDILITSKVAEPFIDVDDADWFKIDVEEAFNYVFTTGTTPTTYNPYADITRAQFAVMIARALELKPTSQNIKLKDIKGTWYQDEAQALYETGIIEGFNDGTFGGEKKLTRQQAATMLGRMLEYTGVDLSLQDDIQFADVDNIGKGAQEAVKYLASHDVLVNGKDVKFNPYNNLTRAQMAKMLVRSLRLTDLY